MLVADTSRAVFLSYASQDAVAAQRICAALRAAGIEVWFDQSELRGGDAWDQKIRQQLRDCALFIPVISANTARRHEGYFRLEWDLADQRTHMIARNRAFIVPVCVDATPETSTDTPESFQRVQWTRLPAGDAGPAFVERIQQLLSAESFAPSFGSAGSAQSAHRQSAAGRLDRGQRVALRSALAAAVLLLLAIGYARFAQLNRPPSSGLGAASIAVLPLANESGEVSQQYFSDGISEDLITALSQFPQLKVIGRTSAFQFRDSKEDSRSIGAKLGVAHLLEGSVRRSGELVRVSAELIDTADGSTQWSERYDRPYKDLFALQDEITRAVAGALRARLLPSEHAAAESERPPGGGLDAYSAMLQGRFYRNRNAAQADFRRAIEFDTQAIALDPRYALAWSELSRSWSDLSANYLEGVRAREAYARAREAVDRALALAPDLAAAHLARRELLRFADFAWGAAQAESRRALALAPNDAEAKFAYANDLATFGELQQAIDLTRQALAIEPLRTNWLSWLASYLSVVNRLDEARRVIQRAIELQPASASYHYTLSVIEVQRGDAAAALAAAQQESPGNWQDIAFAIARQIGADRSAADLALRTLIEKDVGVATYQIAEVYALRNDSKATFDWLDRAWSDRDPGLGSLLVDPLMLRYQDDPRFAAFCRKIGLPVPRARFRPT